MTPILEIKGLTKHFGKIKAVQNLDLTISRGQVYGILGPNGSGKTTTLGMILDVVSPTLGSYSWFGGVPPVEARKQIGTILETPCFYPYLTAVQNLRITAHIKGCDFSRIDIVLRQVNLYERRNDKFKTYSLGMKQRLSIAAALLADPPILILDEPTNGLDPQGIAEIRVLIKDIAAKGKTILLASHLLDEVQKVCSHYCILKSGVKLHEGSVQDLQGGTNMIEVASDHEGFEAVMKRFPDYLDHQPEGTVNVVTLKNGTTPADLNRYFFDNGITLKRLATRTHSLEQEFLKILKEND